MMSYFETMYFILIANYLWIACIILFFLGGALAWLVDRSNFLMRGEQFFLHSSGISFIAVLFSGVWMSPLRLIEADLVDLAVVIIIVGYVLLGVWLSIAGRARSRDAMLPIQSALLAFVPLLNFILIFAPSRVVGRGDRTISYHLIVMGLVLVVAAAGTAHVIENRVRENLEHVEGGQIVESAIMAWEIRRYGLPRALELLADRPIDERQINEITELSAVESHGLVLIREFTVQGVDVPLPQEFSDYVLGHVCESALFKPIYDAGGIVRDRYRSSAGVIIAEVEMSASTCGG